MCPTNHPRPRRELHEGDSDERRERFGCGAARVGTSVTRNYASPASFKNALEQRLRNSAKSGYEFTRKRLARGLTPPGTPSGSSGVHPTVRGSIALLVNGARRRDKAAPLVHTATPVWQTGEPAIAQACAEPRDSQARLA